MLKTYFITALRHFKRDKFFTILNLLGLTIGVTCFILLSLYTRHELSYDKFHDDVDRIYVLADKGHSRNGPIRSERFLYGSSLKLQELIPEVSDMTHLSPESESLITIGTDQFYQEGVVFTDQNFFKIFNFEILQGKPDFTKQEQAVISQNLADQHFFGVSPVGESIEINNVTYQIAAVIEDAPANTHIQYEILLSNENQVAKGRKEFPNENGGSIAMTAVRIPLGTDISDVEAKVRGVIEEVFVGSQKDTFDDNGELISGAFWVPFTDVHLRSQFNWSIFPVSDIRYVYIFGSIAILILVIACLNYVNLATARSLLKMKEVGVRKVLGADKSQIIRQNMTEATLFALISVVLAFAIAERLLPRYNDLVGVQLKLSYLSAEFFVFVIGLSALVGLLAGIYPAIRMSQIKALRALTGRSSSREKAGVRRGLVWFQFFIAQGLIMATLIIQSQLSYLQNKDLGYEREELLYIDAAGDLKDQAATFKEELARISGVELISVSNEILSRNSISFQPMKEIPGYEDSQDYLIFDSFSVDTLFVESMGMQFVEGGNFNSSDQIATSKAIIVNQAFVEVMGWENPIGEKFQWNGEHYVTGIIRDFHNESLKASMKPAVFFSASNPYAYFNIKLKTSNVRETVSSIEAKWNEFVPAKPIQLSFYDQDYDSQYTSETRLGTIFNVFSGIAITISILGLIGLTAFSAEQRLKEFSVRKVLGAELKQLVLLLSKEFVILIFLAFVVASPLAYLGLNGWLESFVYKVEVGPVTFVLALSLTLVIALLSMTYQFRKLSSVNPSETLRNE